MRDPSGQPVSQRTSSAKQFFLNDALGSTIALTDTSGAIVRSYTYDPDGNTTTSGSGATTDLKFAGGHQIGSLYHFAARYYDPTIGRWTQQDPITQYADLTAANRYAYAGGDPTNVTDPAGTCFLVSCKTYRRAAAGAAAVGAFAGATAALHLGIVGTVGCLGTLKTPECFTIGAIGVNVAGTGYYASYLAAKRATARNP